MRIERKRSCQADQATTKNKRVGCLHEADIGCVGDSATLDVESEVRDSASGIKRALRPRHFSGTQAMASRSVDVRTPAWRQTVKAGVVRSGAVLVAASLGVLVVMIATALLSHDGGDVSLSTAASSERVSNWLGVVGAWTSDFLLMLLGPAVALLLAVPLVVAGELWRGVTIAVWPRRMLLATVGIALLGTALALLRPTAVAGLPAGLGGIAGIGGEAILAWAFGFVPAETAVVAQPCRRRKRDCGECEHGKY